MNLKRAALLTLVACVSLCGCTQETPPTQVNTSPVSASATSADGLSLTLSLNASTLHPGDELTIKVAELNTLDTANRVDAAGMWPVQGLTTGPSGLLNSPEGVAVVKGHVTSSMLAGVEILPLYDPNAVYNSPAIFPVTSYEFKPKSYACDVYQGANVIITDMSTIATLIGNGYWKYTFPAGFSTFSPGEYTAVAGDEWGKLVLLYFIVESGSPTSLPVQIVSLTGPLPPYNPGGPTVGITIKNIGNIPIVIMGAALKTDQPHQFNLSLTSPLAPGNTVSATVNLIGPTAGNFSNDVPYPVTIYGTLEDGTVFNYSFNMKISLPPT